MRTSVVNVNKQSDFVATVVKLCLCFVELIHKVL